MRMIRAIALCSGFALCPVAGAADVPFAGTWASDPAQCGKDQGAGDAPLILTATTYSQGEAHCTFEPATEEAGAWKANAKCSVEGDSQDGTFAFVVAGDVLTVRDDTGERKLSRCPSDGASDGTPKN